MAEWFRKVLEPDQSFWNWLLRHSLYWIAFTVALSMAWIYWFGTFKEALLAVIDGFPLTLPIVYGFIYLVLPALLQGHYRPFGIRFISWFIGSFVYRFLLLHYVSEGNVSQTNFTDSELRKLFDTGFMLSNSFVFCAASLKMFRYWYQKEQANQQLIQEALSIELQMLKAQVHPHFLFNTLNTIYSLTLQQSDKAGEAVRKLSILLRYMFTECDTPEVSLSKEMELLRNYIELEQFRYRHRLRVTLTIEGEVINKQIAPLLLIPFVENAFKHGASEQTDQATINVTLLIMDNTLIFSITNSKNSVIHTKPAKPGGLGLQNIRKRLLLLYPDRHKLTIRAEDTQYSVDVTIQLNPMLTPAQPFGQPSTSGVTF